MCHALALVREGLRASLLLVNVQEPAGLSNCCACTTPTPSRPSRREAGEHLLAEGVALCQGGRVTTDRGRAASRRALLDIAEDEGCTLIVAGAHGKGERAKGAGSARWRTR